MTIEAGAFEFFVGQGATGKSTAMRSAALGAERCVWLDVNHEAAFDAAEWRIVERMSDLVPILKAGGGYHVAVRVPRHVDMAGLLNWVCEAALTAGDMLLVWDEVHFYLNGSRLPRTAEHVVRAGRHAGLSVMAATRRPVFATELMANATAIHVFRIDHEDDRLRMSKMVGVQAEMLRVLRVGQYVAWRPGCAAQLVMPDGRLAALPDGPIGAKKT